MIIQGIWAGPKSNDKCPLKSEAERIPWTEEPGGLSMESQRVVRDSLSASHTEGDDRGKGRQLMVPADT